LRAAECAQRATEVQDGYLRGIYEDLAERWLQLAKQVEKLEGERGELRRRRFDHLSNIEQPLISSK
jgi:hypothetical protein